MWDECNGAVVWTFFGIAFPWDWNENWLFPVMWPLGPCHFCTLLCPPLNEMFPWYSSFLEEISSLFHSLFSFISLHCSLKHCSMLSYLSLLFSGTLHSVVYIFPILLCLSPFFLAIYKMFSDNHFALLHFFFLGMVLVTASYTVLRTSVHSSLGSLTSRPNPLILLVTSTV